MANAVRCTLCKYSNPSDYLVCGHCGSAISLEDALPKSADSVLRLADNKSCDDLPTVLKSASTLTVDGKFDFDAYNSTLPNKKRLR